MLFRCRKNLRLSNETRLIATKLETKTTTSLDNGPHIFFYSRLAGVVHSYKIGEGSTALAPGLYQRPSIDL